MTTDAFVEAIKLYACDSAVDDTAKTLERPQGRRPRPDLVRLSNWFNQLSPEVQSAVLDVAREAAEAAIFGTFCIIDGVRAIENGPDKGRYEIYYVNADHRQLLNDAEVGPLHDIFQSMTARG